VAAAVGERATEALVKKQEGDINAFGGQAVCIAAAIACKQAVPFELAPMVAELIECVRFRGEREGGDDCFVDLFGRSSPPTVRPLCRRTSSSRIIRVSWILMPG
jgi:hypothetical protein